MVTLLTLGETLGVGATAIGTPLRTASALQLSTAGAEATVAIGMRRLGHTAAWIGTLGMDEIGARVHRDLAAEGIDTRFVRYVADAPTGFMVRDRRTNEHVSVSYYRSVSAGRRLSEDDVNAAFTGYGAVEILHITGITQALGPSCRSAVLRAAKRAQACGAIVSFDLNYRRTLAEATQAGADARELLPSSDVLFVGHDELHLLTDQLDPRCAARELAAQGPSEVVVKRGKAGACAATGDGLIHEVGSLEVSARDTIGAGDSFVAGYLAARAYRLSLSERLRWATICAACTVGTHGDWEGLPTRAELETRASVEMTIR